MTSHLAWLDYLRLNPGACEDFRAWVEQKVTSATREALEAKDWTSTLAARAKLEAWQDCRRLLEAPAREAAQRDRARR